MVDFYPVLARAISNLPNNDAEARRNLYARARTIVNEQLRGRGLQGKGIEAIREKAALETAIRKVEAESQPVKQRINGNAAPAQQPVQRTAAADMQEHSKNIANSLSKILQAVQSDENRDAGVERSDRKSMNGSRALVPSVGSTAIATRRRTDPAKRLGDAPNSLGTMLFGITYIVAAIAFSGVTYIHGIVWVYEGDIGYVVLALMMAFTLALFIIPPVMIFRKTSALPDLGFLLRFIYLASRRVF